MIKVNVSNLRSDIARFNNLISELEDIKLNMFNQLEESCVNWYDGNSFVFDDKMYLDSKEMDEVISTLKSKRELYDYVCLKYGELGNKIKCELENEEKLMELIEEDVEKCESIINVLATVNMDVSISIKEIEETETDLRDFQKIIKEALDKVREFEVEIRARISELGVTPIEELMFDIEVDGEGSNSYSRMSDKSYIYENPLRKNIMKIDYYAAEENKNLLSEYKIMNKALECYESDTNTELMKEKIEEYKEIVDPILIKRGKYTEILNKVIKLYNNLTDETVKVFTDLGGV